MAFPQIKKQNRGKFTKWAKRNGFKDAKLNLWQKQKRKLLQKKK